MSSPSIVESRQTAWLSIVVPCYNEEAVVEACAERLRIVLRGLIQTSRVTPDSQIVFVNDGSYDRTWDLILQLCHSDPIFSGISLARNFGHQGALLAGLHAVPGDAVVSIDADLQDDVTAIEKMVDCYLTGFDVVYGVRRERTTDTVFKRSTAVAFYRMMTWLGTRTIHNHADFRLMSRRALEALREYHEVSLFLRGIVPLIGYRSTSVYYDRSSRFAGETKYPLRKMIELSLTARNFVLSGAPPPDHLHSRFRHPGLDRAGHLGDRGSLLTERERPGLGLHSVAHAVHRLPEPAGHRSDRRVPRPRVR